MYEPLVLIIEASLFKNLHFGTWTDLKTTVPIPLVTPPIKRSSKFESHIRAIANAKGFSVDFANKNQLINSINSIN